MRIGIATDHGGFVLKEDLLVRLKQAGHEVVDFGAHSLETGDDYPDFVIPLARSVAAGELDRGVAVCGSGVGASIAANKIHGARAALILDHFSARQGVEDDNMNIICVGGRVVGPEAAWDLIRLFQRLSLPRPNAICDALAKSHRQKQIILESMVRRYQRVYWKLKLLTLTDPKLDQLCINTIRTLSSDAVQQGSDMSARW